MNTKIQLGHIYRSRDGDIHRVTTIRPYIDEPRPVLTELISGETESRTFTIYGFVRYVEPGNPQPESPDDLVEDITGSYVDGATAAAPAGSAAPAGFGAVAAWVIGGVALVAIYFVAKAII